MMPYTQSDHDRAVELGGIGVIAAVALAVAVLLIGVML